MVCAFKMCICKWLQYRCAGYGIIHFQYAVKEEGNYFPSGVNKFSWCERVLLKKVTWKRFIDHGEWFSTVGMGVTVVVEWLCREAVEEYSETQH